MEDMQLPPAPTTCPVCRHELHITNLQCGDCGAEVTGRFSLGLLATLREPHASLIELFLQKRGNVKEIERTLGLSYPTVRARLEEAFAAAGFGRVDGEPERMDMPVVDEAEISRRVEQMVAERLRGMPGFAASPLSEEEITQRRKEILDELERGECTAAEATTRLRELNTRRAR